MSKLAYFLAEEKNEFSSMLSVSSEEQPDSQFYAIATGNDHNRVEYLGWGEKHKPIGILQEDELGNTPILNLHLDSKEEIATQELETVLQALIKADYFSGDKRLLLLGDLNINLNDKKGIKILAEIFEKNELSFKKFAVEAPIERERCIEIALNQQPHKGGVKKIDVKNVIFLLHHKLPADKPAIDKLRFAYNALPPAQKMREDGLDHNPIALKNGNILYVSVSNIPTQSGGRRLNNQVIMTADALRADLNLREHIQKTLETIFHIEMTDLKNYVSPLNTALEWERRNSHTDLKFALFLINKMQLFIQTVINSKVFSEYKKNSVTKQFAEEKLSEETLGDFLRESGRDYQDVLDVIADLNPEHGVSKAIRQIMIDDKPYKMKVERLLTNFFEMISPQPNNGYEPALRSPLEMEALRVELVRDLITQASEVTQVKIFCNDTAESDYHSFRRLLAEMLSQYEKSLVSNLKSIPLQIENTDQNSQFNRHRRHSFASQFFKHLKTPGYSANEDKEPKRKMSI